MVVAGTVFRAVLVWNIENGELIHKLIGHTGVIFDVALIGESAIGSVSDDRTVRFWPDA